MYSVVVLMALSGGVDTPDMGGRRGCHGGRGCYGGCYGGGCYGGGYGGCYGGGCFGGYGGCYGGGCYGGMIMMPPAGGPKPMPGPKTSLDMPEPATIVVTL